MPIARNQPEVVAQALLDFVCCRTLDVDGPLWTKQMCGCSLRPGRHGFDELDPGGRQAGEHLARVVGRVFAEVEGSHRVGALCQVDLQIGRLEAKGRERVTLKIIPRQSKPFDLAVKWDYAPAPAQSMIEVQEAKLSISLRGPKEISFGKGEVYRLTSK